MILCHLCRPIATIIVRNGGLEKIRLVIGNFDFAFDFWKTIAAVAAKLHLNRNSQRVLCDVCYTKSYSVHFISKYNYNLRRQTFTLVPMSIVSSKGNLAENTSLKNKNSIEKSYLVTFRLLNLCSIVRPGHRRSGISVYFAFEQQTFTIIFLSNGGLFSKSRCNSIDLSIIEISCRICARFESC